MLKGCCRYCGCTNDRACVTDDGACYWIKPGYCSACRAIHFDALVEAASEWPGPDAGEVFSIGGRPLSIDDGDETLIIKDHVGAVVFSLTASGVYLAPQYDAADVFPIFGIKPPAAVHG